MLNISPSNDIHFLSQSPVDLVGSGIYIVPVSQLPDFFPSLNIFPTYFFSFYFNPASSLGFFCFCRGPRLNPFHFGFVAGLYVLSPPSTRSELFFFTSAGTVGSPFFRTLLRCSPPLFTLSSTACRQHFTTLWDLWQVYTRQFPPPFFFSLRRPIPFLVPASPLHSVSLVFDVADNFYNPRTCDPPRFFFPLRLIDDLAAGIKIR